jgi:hypothetical protein
MAAADVSPLPFQQRAVAFKPPTQNILLSPKNLVSETKGSRVVRKLSRLLSRTSTAGSIGLDSFKASGGSFQSIKTPQMLWPATPTPTASMHPKFHLNSGSSIRQGAAGFAPPASIPELHASPPTVVESCQAAPSAVAAPVPTTQMVWVPMPVMQMPNCSMVLNQPSTAVNSRVPANAVSMPPVLLGRSGCASVGSALHGTGKCQPCAWFWKAGRGCQDGAKCDHCHLCPEGELKARKKAKVAAMRMGLL